MTQEDRGKQEFQKRVGQAIQSEHTQISEQLVSIRTEVVSGGVAARDIVNHHHAKGRLLTKEERRTLNNYVKQLEDEYGEPGKQTWTSIHRILGNDSIEAMSIDQLKPTEAILQLLLSNAQLRRQSVSAGNDPDLAGKLHEVVNSLATVTAERDKLKQFVAQYYRTYNSLEERHKAQTTAFRSLEEKYSKLLDDAVRLSGNSKRGLAAVSQLDAETRRSKRLKVYLGLTLFLICAMGYGALAFRNQAVAARAAIGGCQYEGKTYSLGSVIDNPDAPDIECRPGPSGRPPTWQRMYASPKK